MSLKRFVLAIMAVYAFDHLRLPTNDAIRKMLEMNASRGCPGMIGHLIATCLPNRAACLLQLGEFEECIRDCSKTLSYLPVHEVVEEELAKCMEALFFKELQKKLQ
ncbi:hypothetical protein PPTG_05577 [Phytophthora nicotianae INRA-310]|uniref:Uncharacterized protein n=1 Tax=Phytophthora nicotianae (strain INRA-310) TaxID=761204 RepID=W2R079_PHYN3|nr:hypothetical protein PPTG_05577 [Phytophthora nicotianae INRA-310]ETN17905.1 hypothetical protein PPTG_05577 [Phytophthora nicotianae INRA-310]